MADWGGGLKGAAGGALAGGSFGGPVGAIGGGIIGGLAGLFGGGEKAAEQEEANRKLLMDYYNRVNGRETPQMGPAAQGSLSDFRNNQRDLVTHLQGMSRGQGPSLAAEQLKAATDRNIAQQQAFAATGKGGPLAAQQAANAASTLGARASQDAASARIAEQQMALNQLGLTIHGARGADEEMSRFNAGQQNETAQTNLYAKLKAMGMNDEAALRILGQMSGNTNAAAARPGLADQILAGGAGAFGFGASQRASGKAASGVSPVDPFGAYRRGGPITSPSQV